MDSIIISIFFSLFLFVSLFSDTQQANHHTTATITPWQKSHHGNHTNTPQQPTDQQTTTTDPHPRNPLIHRPQSNQTTPTAQTQHKHKHKLSTHTQIQHKLDRDGARVTDPQWGLERWDLGSPEPLNPQPPKLKVD